MPERDTIRKFVREALSDRLPPGGQPSRQKVEQTSSSTDRPVIDESVKDVIAEVDLRTLPENSRLIVREDAIITPAALDLIRERGIQLERRSSRLTATRQRAIAIGSDHGGFEMKHHLKSLLVELGHRYRDFGTDSPEAVDYPDFAHAVARAVADGLCDFGIILDGAGIGSSIAANKVPGVRAALCYDETTARNSREHNFANVLTLGAKMISSDEMRRIVKTWLETPDGEARHEKRVAKIMAIEKQYLR